MLYGDFIDLEPAERRASTPQRQEGPETVRAHGTGVSTGSATAARSFTLALSVLGNTVAGALFLGGLYLAPVALGRLLGLH